MHVCSGLYSHHEGEVVQSGGRVVRGQVGVQVPRRGVWCHSLDAQLPVYEHTKRFQSSVQNFPLASGAASDTDHAVLCSGWRGWEDIVCGTWMWCPWP